MEAMRSRWTDERIDDLKSTVDNGFKRVEGRLDRIDARIDATNESLGDRMDSLQQAMIIAVVAMCTMMFAGFGALITLFATHF